MSKTIFSDGIVSGRLSKDQYEENFSDLHPPLDKHEAMVAADRCYFCYDAPCITACPTDIDIPLFIRQISTGTAESAAKTIFEQNILGGMCARVCPTETLCEEACVREVAEGKPVEIGKLQRFATDLLMDQDRHPFEREPETGKKICVVGAGPAGLSCAHRLALRGHNVVIFDANKKAGGLNEYGIAAYKTVENFAEKEIEWLLGIGGIVLEQDRVLGKDFSLDKILDEYDAVFLGVGLSGVNALNLNNENNTKIVDAVEFISGLRQTSNLESYPVGREVVVIGGGMTAVDAAVQSKLLGSEKVHLVYRRSRDRMNASKFEQDLATSKGVNIITNAQPNELENIGEKVSVSFNYTAEKDGKLVNLDHGFSIEADQVLKAIGQTFEVTEKDLKIHNGKIKVDSAGQTSIGRVWAGGDCATGGDDLTVTAVAEGRDAAEQINKALAPS